MPSQVFTSPGVFAKPTGVVRLDSVVVRASGGQNAGGGGAYKKVVNYLMLTSALSVGQIDASGTPLYGASDDDGAAGGGNISNPFVSAQSGMDDPHGSGGDALVGMGDVGFSGGNGGTAAGGGGAGSAEDGQGAGGGGTTGGLGGTPDGGDGGDPGVDGASPGGAGGIGALGAGWEITITWTTPTTSSHRERNRILRNRERVV